MNDTKLKRLTCLLLMVCLLGMLCSLTGCKEDNPFQTAFPLEEETVTDLLEKAGLPGVISESETESQEKGHINYTVRSPSETYDGTENGKFVASIGSVEYKGERALLTVFDQSVASEQLVWEDWEKQLVLAALLYGGFGNEDAVYQACLALEFPDGGDPLRWDIELPEGYCKVSYLPRSSTIRDENNFDVTLCSGTLRVNIYESRGLYENLGNRKAD